MDVNAITILPQNRLEELNSQQDRLVSEITAVKTENQKAAASLPPLHSLMANLDAVQGSQELNALGAASSSPAFVVDINSEHKELAAYAQAAFAVELHTL